MVCFADMRSFLEASCCKVEVVKGAAGLLVEGLASTEITSIGTFGDLTASAREVAFSSSSKRTCAVSTPLSLKESPVAIL